MAVRFVRRKPDDSEIQKLSYVVEPQASWNARDSAAVRHAEERPFWCLGNRSCQHPFTFDQAGQLAHDSALQKFVLLASRVRRCMEDWWSYDYRCAVYVVRRK